jgi:fibronectin type 3 domain-containing protein
MRLQTFTLRKHFSLLVTGLFAVVLAGCAGITGSGPTGNGGATVPATPMGLQATAGNAQVALTWSASSGATSYHVKRSTTSGGPYTQVAGPTSASFTDTGLTNGTKYFYVVAAVNSAGESANSSEVNATPTAPATAPSTPTGLQASAGNAQVALIWMASSGATSYHIKRSTTSGGPYTQISAPTGMSFTDTGLTNGTKYFYVVSAVNSVGESANSAEVNATPTAPATAPTAPTNLAATAGNAQISLTWTGSTGATSYHVKRSTTNGSGYTQIAAPTGTSFTDTGLTNGTTYFYVVTAVNSAGESGNSNQASATPTAPVQIPAVPTSLTTTAGNAQVGLNWTASSGATSYHVKRSTTTGGPYTQVGAPTAASFTDTGLTNGTTYFYVVSALNSAGESANSSQVSATPTGTGGAPDVTITIDPTKTKPISPYIYGINFYTSSSDGPAQSFTFDRDGGNRWTAYNWETNASNAGSDYLYESDNYLSSSNVPAEAVRGFIANDQGKNLASLITVQLQGLVSADENGPVSVANPPDLTRFKQVVDKKSTVSSVPFTVTPGTTDANVYMDEFVWALNQKLPGNIFASSATLPTFISLDNEPELWNSTHLEVQGHNPVTSDNYISKTITLAKAIKDQFPNTIIFGPVHYGFQGIYNWQGELSATPSGANWFPDKYLAALKTASASYGKPLVDVYDLHWYAEEYDASGTRSINLNNNLTDAQVQLIVQSPRALWDPTFTDSTNSNPWIYNELGQTPINILGRLQAKINAENPGMKISITEYESGGWNHIAGTIAQADNLGIFGSQGVFAANFWPPGGGGYPYANAGFMAYRNFDGAGSNFGDISLQTTSSNVANVVVYASVDSTKSGRVVFVAINRSKTAQVTALNGQSLSGTAHLYQVTAATAQGQTTVQPVSIGTMPASGSSLTITLPALSVTTIDIF